MFVLFVVHVVLNVNSDCASTVTRPLFRQTFRGLCL